MKFLLSPKPILGGNMSLMAYCLRYHQIQDFLIGAPVRLLDGVIALPFLKVVEDLGIDAITGGAPLFIPINKFSLLADIPSQTTQPAHKMILLLDEQVPPEEPFLSRIKELKEKGFTFAVENITNFGFMDAIIQMCEYVILSFKFDNMKNMDIFMRMSLRYKNQIFIASDVACFGTLEKLKEAGFRFFEGNYYTLPIPKGGAALPLVKINRLQLINAVNQDDFPMEDIAQIVSRDPSMTISLLKMINSPYLGITRKIKSVSQAVAMIGQKEVRKWVVTVLASLLCEDKPSSLARLSLFRAKFAENLAPFFGMSMLSDSLFLTGLFSVLDAILDCDMEEALEMVKVSNEIRTALTEQKGEFYKVLELILAYEAADWSAVKHCIILNDLQPDDILDAYIETAKWYGTILT
ncbi:MAG: HDOD domain-containing protein [Defluviitaleaceae bacterium]|nr:HDOD domain-containing protein [Defluviitaleaceae bacterium]